MRRPSANSGAAASESCGRNLLSVQQWSDIAENLGLSGREMQIVQHLFDGEREVAIAGRLNISRHTVHTYIERVYRKLDVADRSALVRRIFEEFIERYPPNATAPEAPAHFNGSTPRSSPPQDPS